MTAIFNKGILSIYPWISNNVILVPYQYVFPMLACNIEQCTVSDEKSQKNANLDATWRMRLQRENLAMGALPYAAIESDQQQQQRKCNLYSDVRS